MKIEKLSKKNEYNKHYRISFNNCSNKGVLSGGLTADLAVTM